MPERLAPGVAGTCVAQASRLWDHRASCPVERQVPTRRNSPGETPGGPTGRMPVRRLPAAVVVLFLLIANALCASDKAMPDSPAGRLFEKWQSADNAADEAALRDFAEEHYTPEARGGRSVLANRDPSIAEDAAQYAVDRLL